MFEIQAQKDYTFYILYACISIDEPMVHDLSFSLCIVTIGWLSTSRAWLLIGEHSNQLRHTNAENFRSAIQKKNAGKQPCVYWHSALSAM